MASAAAHSSISPLVSAPARWHGLCICGAVASTPKFGLAAEAGSVLARGVRAGEMGAPVVASCLAQVMAVGAWWFKAANIPLLLSSALHLLLGPWLQCSSWRWNWLPGIGVADAGNIGARGALRGGVKAQAGKGEGAGDAPKPGSLPCAPLKPCASRT